MRAFYESTTAQFGLIILSTAALAAGFTDYKWSEWAELAKYVLITYAGKEGVRMGSDAYKGKNGTT